MELDAEIMTFIVVTQWVETLNWGVKSAYYSKLQQITNKKYFIMMLLSKCTYTYFTA